MVSSNMPRRNIFYLFEGDVTDQRSPAAANAVASAMVSTYMRDGFSCVQVNNMRCSVRWIMDKHVRLEIREEAELEAFPDDGQARYVDMNTNKRYYSGENRIISILCAVNGVSQRIASAIRAEYPYFDDLVNAAYMESFSGRDPHLLLSRITVENKHGKRVKLGKALSRAVIDKFDICRFKGMPPKYRCNHDHHNQNNTNNNRNNESINVS